MILTLLCLAFNPLAPNLYAQEMQRIEQVREILNEQQKEVKKETKIVKKQIKKIERVQSITLPAELPKSGTFDTDSLYTDVVDEYTPVEVKQITTDWANRIREISKEVGYNNPELAVRIARCESGLREWAKNPNSSAWWLFQHLWRYWDARAKRYWFAWASRFNWEANAYVSISMLRDGQISHWKESKHCRWK